MSLPNKYGTFCCLNSNAVKKLFEAFIYEDQPFYLLELIPKPRENALFSEVSCGQTGTVDAGNAVWEK